MIRFRESSIVEDHPENPLKKWRDKFDENSLEHKELIQYFHAASPLFINIDQKEDLAELGNCSFHEEGAKTAIIDVLEQLMCGDNPEIVFAKLKHEDNVPSVCGRVFKIGEPTYSCRECSMDPTCVLCAACFKKSSHRHHKYKMATSSGGGCCDCGDREAWKKDVYCDLHILGTQKQEESTIITDKMKKLCNIIFRAVLEYCYRSLQIESDSSMKDIQNCFEEDIYCTILYNDETHTFEQVIQTLTSIVKCTQKEAVEYVTSIDREGRAVVKCTTFALCTKLKNDIEKKAVRTALNPKISPLKVAVLHKNAIAFQHFAMQLLSWLQEFLTQHAIFRTIFSDILSEPANEYGMKQILLYDHKLWKSARTSWHRLLISGMLMEYENKKKLATIFIKNYTSIMQDFIRDDHYHSFSIVSLSVQLFTVPTIAQSLIANDLAFFKLLHTYYSECVDKHVKQKVLQFAKNTSTLNVFKRAAYILIDLKYLLSFKPDVWTEELRSGFLHGVQIMIRLFKCMQGMDAATRQIGQHMEFEPEWESAFTLHIKLSHLITLIIDWCSSDEKVLVKVYKMLLSALSENKFIVSQTEKEVKELADHSTTCLVYDVSTKPVSIHLPLTRFLAGLLVHFGKYNLTFDTVTTQTYDKPTPEEIIEPVLCTRTMVSQVHAGMWRRNGYSILNQIYFYRNVKCRSEMLDRDIIILQIGASLIESNEFMIHVMNKFNLITWTEADYDITRMANKSPSPNIEEDTTRQIINMVDELLELLIMIVGERYVPGIGEVTDDDRIRKEIVQQLCIKPHSHSELNRALNEDMNSETGMENVIDTVAVFKKPKQSDKKGVYVLKKEFYKEYNMYFYHYNKEEKSKSEEAQRKRRQENKELLCCPPPKLIKLTEQFGMLVNLLQCDVMLLVMQTVLKRSIDLKAISFSESHLQKILHLIGYAVQEEESNYYPFFKFIDRSHKWLILPLMEELVNSARVESQRDLIIWTVKKFKDVQQIVSATAGKTEDEGSSDKSEPMLDDSEEKSAAAAEKAEKENRAQMAAKRRQQILAQMESARKSFMSQHSDLFGLVSAEEDEAANSAATTSNTMDWQEIDEVNPNTGLVIDDTNKVACIGRNRKLNRTDDQMHTCILCSDDSIVNKSNPCMVYPAFIQKSSVLSRYQKTNEIGQLQFLETSIHPSPHTSTCGHVMHAACWEEYFNNEVIKENRRPYRNRTPILFDIEKKEFLCPLCRFLSNTVLPLLPTLQNFTETQSNRSCIQNRLDFVSWHNTLYEFSKSLQVLDSQTADVLDDNGKMKTLINSLYENSFLKVCAENCQVEFDDMVTATGNDDQIVNAGIQKYISNFTECIRTIAPYPNASKEIEDILVTWLSCAYTIESLEMWLRATEKPLKGELSIRHTSCLSGLVRLCGMLGIKNSLEDTIDDNFKLNLNVLYHFRELYDIIFGRKGSSILEWDNFGMLVSLLFTTRSIVFLQNRENIIVKGSQLDYTIFESIFLVHILRIIIIFDYDNQKDIIYEGASSAHADEDIEMKVADADNGASTSANTAIETDDDDLLLFFYRNYNIYITKDTKSIPTRAELIDEIKRQSQTFLRCSCIFFHFITDVELPNELQELSGDTFDVMSKYLGLNVDIKDYFTPNSVYVKFMQKLADHPDIINFQRNIINKKSDEIVPIMSSIPPIRQLIALPDDYSDLINSVSLFTCPNNERDDSRNPTMCLVCGEILCSQTYCCQKELDKNQVGACTYHVHTCGAGIGIFLRIRDSEILLLAMNKGCFISAPYLDEYGETDQGLRRGNPLTLCKERYKKLHLTWLSHGVHEEITRKTESAHGLYATQWQHL